MISLVEALGGIGFLAAPWLPQFFKINLFFQFRNRSLASVFKFLCGIVSCAVWSWMVLVEGRKPISSLIAPWGWILVLAVVMLSGYWLLWMKFHERAKAPRAGNSMLGVIAVGLLLMVGGTAALAVALGALKGDLETERLSGNLQFPSNADVRTLSRMTTIHCQPGVSGTRKGPYRPAASGKFVVRIPRNSDIQWRLTFNCPEYKKQTVAAVPGSEVNIQMQKQEQP